MKKLGKIALILFAACCLAALASCSYKPPSDIKTSIDDGEPFGFDWGIPFENIDENADGFLHQQEWNKWGGYYPDGGTDVFYNVDKDNNRMIDKMEYEQAQKNPPAPSKR